jgi:hypothetical protein
MLKQEDLAFLQGLSSIRASPALLQELQKAMRRKKALAVAGSASSQSKPGSTALPAPLLP